MWITNSAFWVIDETKKLFTIVMLLIISNIYCQLFSNFLVI